MLPIIDQRIDLRLKTVITEYRSLLTQLKECNNSSACNTIYTELKGVAANIISVIKEISDCGPSPKNCNTLLHEVCWLSVKDWEYNLSIPDQEAIQEDYEATVAGIRDVVSPIWRPNTKYQVAFTLKDIIKAGEASEHEFKYHYGFRTAGTVGHYHNAPNVSYGGPRDGDGDLIDPDNYALATLEQYIDYKRSYPNADGNLLRSKPLFYGAGNAQLLLFYTKPYVLHMFKDQWDAYAGVGTFVIDVLFQSGQGIIIWVDEVAIAIAWPAITYIRSIVVVPHRPCGPKSIMVFELVFGSFSSFYDILEGKGHLIFGVGPPDGAHHISYPCYRGLIIFLDCLLVGNAQVVFPVLHR